jgi:hypothetical protein
MLAVVKSEGANTTDVDFREIANTIARTVFEQF